MIVRIRLRTGRQIRRTDGKNRHLAAATAALLVPAALVAYVLGFWRLAADMGVAGEFAIQGLFSHWQVWLMLAAGLTIASSLLNRYGRGDQVRVPKILQFRPRPESPEPIVNKARVQ